jgi:hypothetical protein
MFGESTGPHEAAKASLGQGCGSAMALSDRGKITKAMVCVRPNPGSPLKRPYTYHFGGFDANHHSAAFYSILCTRR